MGSHEAGATFGKCKRLLNAGDYSRVFDKPDAKASHRNLLLLGRCNDRSRHRLGLIIAKKHVRLAAERNRIKRLARESFRVLPVTAPTFDVVLLARPGIGNLDNAELSSILQQQWQKLIQRSVTNRDSNHRDS